MDWERSEVSLECKLIRLQSELTHLRDSIVGLFIFYIIFISHLLFIYLLTVIFLFLLILFNYYSYFYYYYYYISYKKICNSNLKCEYANFVRKKNDLLPLHLKIASGAMYLLYLYYFIDQPMVKLFICIKYFPME